MVKMTQADAYREFKQESAKGNKVEAAKAFYSMFGALTPEQEKQLENAINEQAIQLYGIFKSEGGYRVAAAMWGDDPIVRQCPWFATRDEAEAARQKIKDEAERRAQWMPKPDFDTNGC
jgi:hypothetical protein